jgi:Flp pilus assembly protein TadG
MHALLRELTRFRRDKSGNVVTIFVIALIPLLSAIGGAVDYTTAARMKAKLQSAADAASVASISQRSPGYIAASLMTGNGTVTAGVTDANNVFAGNMNGVAGYTNLVLTSTVTKTGVKLDSNVQFSADVPTVFMRVVGFQQMTVTGRSAASASLPPYLDFYLMLDVSGSMGLPSTDAEQTRLSAINPDNFGQYPGGCTLACHFAVQNVCSYKQLLHGLCANARRPDRAHEPPQHRVDSQRAEAETWVPDYDGFRHAGFAQHRSHVGSAGGIILSERRPRRLHPVARRRSWLRRHPIVQYG